MIRRRRPRGKCGCFKAKLDRAGREETAWFDWLLPRADAFITSAGKAAVNYAEKQAEKKFLGKLVDSSKISILGALSGMFGAGFAGTLKTTTVDGTCSTVTVSWGIENTVTNWMCGDWKAKNVQIAAGTATKQIGYTKDLELNLKWNEEESFVCPKIPTEGKAELTALIEANEPPNKSVWFKWVGRLDKGEHKSADVYRVDDPDGKAELKYSGTLTFLPAEGINKDPIRVDIPPDPLEYNSPDSTRGPTPYKSTDAMPVPEMVTYKEAFAARRLISLSNTMKVVAQNCRQTLQKSKAPEALKPAFKPGDASIAR